MTIIFNCFFLAWPQIWLGSDNLFSYTALLNSYQRQICFRMASKKAYWTHIKVVKLNINWGMKHKSSQFCFKWYNKVLASMGPNGDPISKKSFSFFCRIGVFVEFLAKNLKKCFWCSDVANWLKKYKSFWEIFCEFVDY